MNEEKVDNKPIIGYEKEYKIYNDGRVWSNFTNRFLKSGISSNGYMLVNLCKEGQQTSFNIHRLVASHFIPNIDNKPYVDHIDGDIVNNHVSNLRWATGSENIINQKRSSRNTSGEKNVSWQKLNNKWQVILTVDGRLKYFGCFKDKNEAVAEARRLREEIYGEFHNHQ
jgi:hypothetical protein